MGVRCAAAMVFVLTVWTFVSAALAFAMPAGRSLAVIGPDGIRAVVAAGGLLLKSNAVLVIARSDDPDFVTRLYAAGAMLVLDAEGAGGCTGLPPAKARYYQPSSTAR